jgi:hypothetical protein
MIDFIGVGYLADKSRMPHHPHHFLGEDPHGPKIVLGRTVERYEIQIPLGVRLKVSKKIVAIVSDSCTTQFIVY